MSPEQAKGNQTDTRADTWGFGAVVYEMLTGKRAFDGEDVSDTLAAVLRAEIDWSKLPSETPAPLRRLLERCLNRDLRRRLADIREARIAIEDYLADPSGVLVQPTGDVVQAPPRRILPWVAALMLALITGVAAWNLKPTEPQPLAPATRFYHELPDGQAFTRGGRPLVAVSPDGSQIVYVANSQLYLRNLNEMVARPIQGTDEDPNNPFFSPGGEWVGYYSTSDSQLKKISTIGGAPVTLCDAAFPFGASWGSDDTIVYGQPEGIMRVSANGGTPELVISTEAPEQVHGPQMLPGGEWVLFTLTRLTSVSGITRWDEAQIVVQSLESGERKILWEGGSDARYVPTGHLVYALEDVLFALPFDLASLEASGGPVPMVEGVRRAPPQFTASAHYGFSDRGTLIYIPGTAAMAQMRVLALVDRDGLVERLNAPPKEYLSPRLSPDGQTLLVQSVEENGNVIWLYDLTGDTAIQQLTFEGNNQRPVWTPDGQRIAFSSDRDGTMSLYWMPADGSGVAERLTTAEEGTSHWMGSWSPDGELLVFNVERALATDWDIWTLSVDDRETQSLYDTPETIYMGAELSPNAEWLAYGAGPIAGEADIYVEPFPPTGARRRISQDGGYWPLWSPEGSEFFYRPVSTSAGITLRSVDIVTQPAFAFSNEQTLPVEGFNVVGYYRDYDISPDGKRLLMVFPADQSDSGEPARPQINIVLNWFEELKERVPVP